MEDLHMNKLTEEELSAVDGGANSRNKDYKVRPINPIWVVVTASYLNCRYTPNGRVAKVYKRGKRLKVDGITSDGKWYGLWIYDPEGGISYAYIAKEYTRLD